MLPLSHKMFLAMPTKNQKTAIARILSDLIKADNIIENQEIEEYNRIIKLLEISQQNLIEAQGITLADAFKIAKTMSRSDKESLWNELRRTASSDDACVAREALILLSLEKMMYDTADKYGMVSYDTMGSYTTDKYVIYIESEEMPAINDDIIADYEHIVNMLKLWKFDFIYIPRFAQRFGELDEDYVHSIIRYMNPSFDAEKVGRLYQKMIGMTTESFCRDMLINQRGQRSFHDIEPSLLINIGTSVVPYCGKGSSCQTYTEFLTIKLDQEKENCVTAEIRNFLEGYQDLLTEPEYYRPDRRKNFFKYFGFYKTIFDFLSRAEIENTENRIEIDIVGRTIKMRGILIKLTPSQLATYVLILHQSILGKQEGLPKLGVRTTLSAAAEKRINAAYKPIFNRLSDIGAAHTFSDEDEDLRIHISRIRAELKRRLPAADLNYFHPGDTPDKRFYKITINPDDVYIICPKSDANGNKEKRIKFSEYNWE